MKTVYDKLISRNWFFVDEKIQKKIHETKIGFIGCGLGSNIAILATRMGFSNFTLCDGDKVEISNLNRQNFFIKDVNNNKAESLAKYIRQINPRAKIRVVRQFINYATISKIEDADILINTANFSNEYFKITRHFIRKKKIVLLPLNIGFGSVVLVFKRINSTFKKMEKNVKNDLEMYDFLLKNLNGIDLLGQYKLPKLLKKIVNVGFDPQLGVASNLSASLTLVVIINFLKKKKNVVFPDANHVDLLFHS
ncbi:MAG: ThiF family adenylyltransferase [Patescibacteria group bacterium]|jgi:hypothetical protein